MKHSTVTPTITNPSRQTMSPRRQQTMPCPRCHTTDLDERDRQGVAIDVCPTCRGVWLDRGELEKLIAYALADSPSRRRDNDDDDDDDRARRAPRSHDDDDHEYDRGRRRGWWDIFD